jgi:hypothetical protein
LGKAALDFRRKKRAFCRFFQNLPKTQTNSLYHALFEIAMKKNRTQKFCGILDAEILEPPLGNFSKLKLRENPRVNGSYFPEDECREI